MCAANLARLVPPFLSWNTAAWTGTEIGGEGPPRTPPAIGIGRRNGETTLTLRGRSGRGSRSERGGQGRLTGGRREKVKKEEDDTNARERKIGEGASPLLP
jgi:hypothetical protein